jgi:hypothetical protein
MATATQSYAATKNAVYNNNSSNLVDLVQRYNDTVKAMPVQAQRNHEAKLAKALQKFKKNNPGLKSINDPKFRLCKSLMGKLKDIQIDTTMQREPMLNWIITIIENFRAYQAQPIQVYATATGYGAWDGQHTSLALYLIATKALGMNFEDVEVPVNIYDIVSRGEIRGNFINNNTTVGKNAGKKPLDIIDIWQQMIYGVEVDGVAEPEWENAHAKWKALAAAGLFITADKFNDTEEVGAIGRLDEINKFSVNAVKKFAVYGKYVTELQQRSINTKEIPIIMEFFSICEQQDITYTNDQIEDLAQHCVDLFGANFDAKGPFWDQVHQANVNAWDKHNKGKDTRDWTDPPRNSKNVAQGIAFFWHQLKNTWVSEQGAGFKFPKQPVSVYAPDAKDLF